MNRAGTYQHWLTGIQTGALFSIPILTPHTAFWVLGFAPTHLNIIYELHGIVAKPTDIAVGILILSTLIRLLADTDYRRELSATGVKLTASPVVRAGAALNLWMFVSVMWAKQPVLALYQACMTSLMLMLALVLADWTQRRNSRRALGALTLAATFQAALTTGQSLRGGSLGLGWLGEAVFAETRGRGLTFNPNTEASYLVISLFVAVVWFTLAENRRSKSLILTGGAVIISGILATGSDGALVAAGISLAWLLIRTKPERKRSRLLVAAITGVTVLTFSIQTSHALQDLSRRLQFAFPLTLDVLRETPLLGTGAGNLMVRADALASLRAYGTEEHFAYGQLQPAHNAYLTCWAELGLPGLLLLLAIGGYTGKGLFTPTNTASFIVSCCLLAVGIIMLVEFHFWLDVHWRLLLFWLMGLWTGYVLKAENAISPVTPAPAA